MPKTHDYRTLATIGRRLAAQRGVLGMSQADVAGHAKITGQQLSSYERGLSDPPLSTLLRLMRVLRVAPTELLDRL
jgi:transcriptional regulator with XRE-family HTH domain